MPRWSLDDVAKAAADQARKSGRKPVITTADFDAAADFALACDVEGLPAHVRECPGIPGRRFRFDLAWPEQLVAVEIHGGHWTGGRHTRGKGFESDLEKSNLAQLNGWTYLAFTADAAKREPRKCIEVIRKALGSSDGETET